MSAQVELLAMTPDPERIIELAARTSYKSFHRMGEGSAPALIRKLIRSGHESVLEHAYATFRIRGGSRAFTHQLVRHRLASYTQESQRYVDEAGFEYVTPPSVQGNPEALKVFGEAMEVAREAYRKLRELGVPKQDARFVLPNATTSEIVVSANFREWRHIFSLRCHPSAQWEIRKICLEILKILKEKAPSVFEDFRIDEERNAAWREHEGGEAVRAEEDKDR